MRIQINFPHDSNQEKTTHLRRLLYDLLTTLGLDPVAMSASGQESTDEWETLNVRGGAPAEALVDSVQHLLDESVSPGAGAPGDGAPSPSLPTGPDGWQNVYIRFCNHEAVFQGDVIVTPYAVTVIAKGPRFKLLRGAAELAKASWHIFDDEPGTYWNTTTGRFILPRVSAVRLK